MQSSNSFSTPSGYTNQDIYQMCREKNFSRLNNFLSANIKDLSYKILVTAVLQVYFPEGSHKLSTHWDDSLRPGLVAPFDNMINSAVCLLDFVRAHEMAKSALQDEKVAACISDYVKANKNVLGQLFNDTHIEFEDKDGFLKDMEERFGDLTVSKDEKFTFKAKDNGFGGTGNSMFDWLMRKESEFAAQMSSGVNVDSSPESSPGMKR